MIQITKNSRGYTTEANRSRAVAALFNRGYNYFVIYKDVQSSFALQYGRASWVADNSKYVQH